MHAFVQFLGTFSTFENFAGQVARFMKSCEKCVTGRTATHMAFELHPLLSRQIPFEIFGQSCQNFFTTLHMHCLSGAFFEIVGQFSAQKNRAQCNRELTAGTVNYRISAVCSAERPCTSRKAKTVCTFHPVSPLPPQSPHWPPAPTPDRWPVLTSRRYPPPDGPRR